MFLFILLTHAGLCIEVLLSFRIAILLGNTLKYLLPQHVDDSSLSCVTDFNFHLTGSRFITLIIFKSGYNHKLIELHIKNLTHTSRRHIHI